MNRLCYILLALLCAGPVLSADFADTLDQGQNADGMFDTKIYSNSPYNDYNFGASTTLTLAAEAGLLKRALLWFNNWDTATVLHGVGTVVDSAFLEAYCETDTNETVSMYELLKPTFLTTTSYEGTGNASSLETGVMAWDAWYWVVGSGVGDSVWGKVGCDSANDAGLQNRVSSGVTPANEPASCSGWSNCSLAYSSNDSRARTGTQFATMILTNFTMAVPTGATVTNIEVKYEGYSSLNPAGSEVAWELTKDGSTAATSTYDVLTVAYSAGGTDANYTDAAAALWGTTWTAAEVNASTFGVRITCNTSGNYTYCDQVLVTITYTNLGADRKATAMASTTCADGTWARWKIASDVLADWIDGDKLPWGVILISDAQKATVFTSSEGTAAQRPRWIIWSHTASAGTSSRRRMMINGGGE
jgi:hypothetical protein